MKFDIKKKVNPNRDNYHNSDIDLAVQFAKKAHQEFGMLIKAVVLFGSAARREKAGDVDVLVIIDDVSIVLTTELQQTYRILIEKIVGSTSLKLHITTLRFSSFWEYTRAGDPIAINILRDGVPLIDTGFFEPLQHLLKEGRLRPTQEAIYAYFNKAPSTLHNSKWHIMQGTLDLYWAVIDSAHAVLMLHGAIPPSPAHIADLMEERLVKEKLLDKKYATTVRHFYNLSKMILHREIKEINGDEFEKYHKEAEDFVNKMKEFLDKKKA